MAQRDDIDLSSLSPFEQAPAREFDDLLSEMTVNSRPVIHFLTSVAADNANHRNAIAFVLEWRIYHSSSDKKLPLLYLLDSVVKNVRYVYSKRIAENIVETFTNAYEFAPLELRQAMKVLLNTWVGLFENPIIEAIWVRLQEMDKVGPKSGAVYVNPRALRKPNGVQDFLEKKALEQKAKAGRSKPKSQAKSEPKTESAPKEPSGPQDEEPQKDRAMVDIEKQTENLVKEIAEDLVKKSQPPEEKVQLLKSLVNYQLRTAKDRQTIDGLNALVATIQKLEGQREGVDGRQDGATEPNPNGSAESAGKGAAVAAEPSDKPEKEPSAGSAPEQATTKAAPSKLEVASAAAPEPKVPREDDQERTGTGQPGAGRAAEPWPPAGNEQGGPPQAAMRDAMTDDNRPPSPQAMGGPSAGPEDMQLENWKVPAPPQNNLAAGSLDQQSLAVLNALASTAGVSVETMLQLLDAAQKQQQSQQQQPPQQQPPQQPAGPFQRVDPPQGLPPAPPMVMPDFNAPGAGDLMRVLLASGGFGAGQPAADWPGAPAPQAPQAPPAPAAPSGPPGPGPAPVAPGAPGLPPPPPIPGVGFPPFNSMAPPPWHGIFPAGGPAPQAFHPNNGAPVTEPVAEPSNLQQQPAKKDNANAKRNNARNKRTGATKKNNKKKDSRGRAAWKAREATKASYDDEHTDQHLAHDPEGWLAALKAQRAEEGDDDDGEILEEGEEAEPVADKGAET